MNWIKYLPLELRKNKHPCKPSGPSINSATLKQCAIEHNHIEFRAPRHSYLCNTIIQMPIRHYHQKIVLRSFNDGVMENDDWKQDTFFARGWNFWGAWLTGKKASLSMNAMQIAKAKNFEYPSEISFFHPRAFENVVGDYLNATFGHKNSGINWPAYEGPNHWQPRNLSGTFGASFDVQQVIQGEPTSLRFQHLLFPITKSSFIDITFIHSVTSATNAENQRLVDPAPLNQLSEDIINSFKVKLSSESQAEWDRVKAECPDMSLATHFAPLKWPTASSPETAASAITSNTDDNLLSFANQRLE